MNKSDNIKTHFEEEAAEYDELILKLIPHYIEMIHALISAIPFKKTDSIEVMDLGCGTGTITKSLKDSYPNSHVTCLDIAENMLEMAKIKLIQYKDIDYMSGNFYHLKFSQKYDVIISSLAIHHLVTDEDKKEFYSKIYNALNSGGVFLNADVVLGSNDHLQELYLDKWKEFLNQSFKAEDINEKWVPTAENEDNPSKLIDQLAWLSEIGFKDVDVIWKYYGGAVYGGIK
ncbi:MAG: class I SAM-dependent methyltransferase [Methanobacterium sp.]